MQEKRLFLLDAYALIYRSYYAFIKNPRINSKGINTSAILGFVNTLEELLRKENPSHIAVGFDPQGPTFRHEAYEQYKAQREETPEVIRYSVPIIKEIIQAYNIPIIEVLGFEADDVIGSLAKLAEKEGFDTYMMTPDKDYGQLVSSHIFMYRPKFGGDFEILGPEEIKTKYGIQSPEQVIDILGLMGDSSDNIPGVAGVGPKTAKELLAKFGSLDGVYAHLDDPSIRPKLREKLEAGKENAYLSFDLATIRTDAPIDFALESAAWDHDYRPELYDLFLRLEFQKLIDKYHLRPRLGRLKEKTVFDRTSDPFAQQVAHISAVLALKRKAMRQIFQGIDLRRALLEDIV